MYVRKNKKYIGEQQYILEIILLQQSEQTAFKVLSGNGSKTLYYAKL